jgi:hypothetical protein
MPETSYKKLLPSSATTTKAEIVGLLEINKNLTDIST